MNGIGGGDDKDGMREEGEWMIKERKREEDEWMMKR